MDWPNAVSGSRPDSLYTSAEMLHRPGEGRVPYVSECSIISWL